MRKTCVQNGRDLGTNKRIVSAQPPPVPVRNIKKPPTEKAPIATVATIRCIETPAKKSGNDADTCCTPVRTPGEAKKSVENTVPVVGPSSVSAVVAAAVLPPTAETTSAAASMLNNDNNHLPLVGPAEPAVAEEPAKIAAAPEPQRSPLTGGGGGLSPRLEMRLALNNDIMGDEDLICYGPGPDLAAILGHDLSTYHRFTGRDLISRSASRVQPKEACISFSQQKNSKMDTPTPNRKKPSPSTWNNSASAARGKFCAELKC